MTSRMLGKLNTVVVLMTTSNSPLSTAAMYVAAGAWRRVFKELHLMKKAIVCALLVLTIACCGTALYAQMQAPGPGGPNHMPPSADQRLQHLTQMLNLTSDQQTKIKPILENETTQLQTMMSDTSITTDDKRSKMRSIRQNTISQINTVLTPEQQKKWEAMRAQHMPPPGAGATAPNAVGPGGEAPQPPPQQ
jgi:periplasmic protein CpxP/Spy